MTYDLRPFRVRMPATAGDAVSRVGMPVHRLWDAGARPASGPGTGPIWATAHRLGARVRAAAPTLPDSIGMPVRKVPAMLNAWSGVQLTQGALTQDALQGLHGPVSTAYEDWRATVPQAPVVHTDDTGWRVGGEPVSLMPFETKEATVYQIRPRHRYEEVPEMIPADYDGVLVTDRGRSSRDCCKRRWCCSTRNVTAIGQGGRGSPAGRHHRSSARPSPERCRRSTAAE
jgi:hypothetical protein